MQQQDRRRVRRAGLAVEDVDAVDLGGAVVNDRNRRLDPMRRVPRPHAPPRGERRSDSSVATSARATGRRDEVDMSVSRDW